MIQKSPLSDLLFPPTCFHCNQVQERAELICPSCQELFTLLPAQGRCQKCFGEISLAKGVCKPCRKKRHSLRQLASCFEATGPALSLANAYKQGHLFLAKELAALIVIQIENLAFPPFDAIVPVPHLFSKHSQLLAKELALFLSTPYTPSLKRSLNRHPHFQLKKKCNNLNQTVLLLDVIMNRRETIREAAQVLERGGAENLYGMTFCAT